MMDETAMGVPLGGVARIIQVAPTPVFPLSGIGPLLDVIIARRGRVAGQSGSLAGTMLPVRRALPAPGVA